MAQGKRTGGGKKGSQEGKKVSGGGEVRLPMRFLVVSGRDHMQVSTSANGNLEDLSISGLVFQTPEIRKDALHPYYIEECRQVNSMVDIPVIAVGGMRKLEEISEVVEGGIADAVSMCRPFIMDQHIVHKFRQGLVESSACNSCNGCIEWMHKQDIHCIYNEKLINY